MLDGGKLEVVIINFVIVITITNAIIINVTIMEVVSGEEEEWVITMVGEQFYLYTIKVVIIMMMMMITMLIMLVIIL